MRCPKYESIKNFYDKGYYSLADMASYYRVGCLTLEQYQEITGDSFPWAHQQK